MAMLDSSFSHAWPGVSAAVGLGPEDPLALAESPSGQGSVPLSRVSWASDGAGSWDGTDLTGQESMPQPEVPALDSDQMEQRLRQQRDRNRQAQNRYRQKCRARKKAIVSSYDQVNEDLGAARAEMAALRQQTALLDKLLNVRDTYISLLQQSKDELSLTGFKPSCRGCRELSEPLLTPGQTVVLHCACYTGEAEHWNPDLHLTQSEQAAFRAQGVGGLQQVWQEANDRVQEAAQDVAAGVGGAELVDELMARMLAGRTLSWRIAHYFPGHFAEVAGISAPSTSAPGLWDALVADLALSPRQLERLGVVAHTFHRSLEALAAEREGLVSGLVASQVVAEGAMLQFAANSLQTRERVFALESSLERELRVHGDAVGAMFSALSTPQHARLFCGSRPFLPDVACILAAVERALGPGARRELAPGKPLPALALEWAEDEGPASRLCGRRADGACGRGHGCD